MSKKRSKRAFAPSGEFVLRPTWAGVRAVECRACREGTVLVPLTLEERASVQGRLSTITKTLLCSLGHAQIVHIQL